MAGLTPLENRTLLDSEDSTVGFSNGVSHAATLTFCQNIFHSVVVLLRQLLRNRNAFNI
jgi:hypothetical protein